MMKGVLTIAVVKCLGILRVRTVETRPRNSVFHRTLGFQAIDTQNIGIRAHTPSGTFFSSFFEKCSTKDNISQFVPHQLARIGHVGRPRCFENGLQMVES